MIDITFNSDCVFSAESVGHHRSAQEDSHNLALNTPNGNLFVVCDGMGGHVGGKTASTIAVDAIVDYLTQGAFGDIPQALSEALMHANMQILGYAQEHPELKGMGTTACVVLEQGNVAYIAHVGDSRIYLYLGQEGQLHRVTKDHSYVQQLVDAGQITDEEAENHPNKNRILQALGIRPNFSPTINVVQPKNGDIFLICSDGLNGMITDADIASVLGQVISLGDKGTTLINMALSAGGYDNVTVELIQVSESSNTESRFISFNPRPTAPVVTHPTSAPVQPAAPAVHARRVNFGRIFLWLLGILIVLGILFGASLLYKSIQEKNPLESLEKELGECQTEIKKLNDDINHYNEQIKYLKGLPKPSKESEVKINKYKEEIKSCEQKLVDTTKKRDSIQSEISKLDKKENNNESNHSRKRFAK